MICKFGIEVCYAPLGEFQIRGSEDLLETLLKQQRLSSTHTIWTIKFEICGSKHHTLGIPAQRRTSAAMHHQLSCIPAGRGFAAISFFSEDRQNVCSSGNFEPLIFFNFVLKTFSRAGFALYPSLELFINGEWFRLPELPTFSYYFQSGDGPHYPSLYNFYRVSVCTFSFPSFC